MASPKEIAKAVTTLAVSPEWAAVGIVANGCVGVAKKIIPPVILGLSCACTGAYLALRGEDSLKNLGLLADNQDGRNEPTPITTPTLLPTEPIVMIDGTPHKVITATPANSPTVTEASTDIAAAAAEPARETRPTLIPDEDPYIAFCRDMLAASEGGPVSELPVEDPQSGTSGPLGKNLPTLLSQVKERSKLPDQAKVTIDAIVSALAQMTGDPAIDQSLKNQIWQSLVGLSEACGNQCKDLINDLSNYLQPGAEQEEPIADNQPTSAPENIPTSAIPPATDTERPTPTATATATAVRPTATATSQPLDIFATFQKAQDNILETAQAEVTAAANATVRAYQEEATAAANAAAKATVGAYQEEATAIAETATAQAESTPTATATATKRVEAAQTPAVTAEPTAMETKKPAATETPSPMPTLPSQAEKPFWENLENLWGNLFGGGESPDAGSRGFD